MTTVRAVFRRLRFVIPISVLVSAGPSLTAAPPTFSTKQLITPVLNGLLPFDVRTEDIDQDGDLDITVAAYSGRIEPTIPAPGTGFYYFVRASNDCGAGTLGAGTSGAPRNTGACP